MRSIGRKRTLSLVVLLSLLLPAGLALQGTAPRAQAQPPVPPRERVAHFTPASQAFAGGSGTEGDPYLVATADQLDAVRNHLDSHFLQIADINLGVTPWNQGEGWEPIGAFGTGNQFTGSFDGGGYVIRNLTINRPTTTVQGLFGYVNSASLSNLTLQDVDIQAASISGGLAASLQASTVDNVTVTGAVISSLTQPYTAIGGLAGESSSSALHLIAITATVQGRTRVGGLIGRTGSGGAIRHASTLGSVVGGDHTVGGLVGYLGEGVPIVSNTYSRASVSGTDYVGGLVGNNYTGAIHRAYSTGAVVGTGDNVGGLLGASGDRTDDCYWDTETSGQDTSAGGEGVSGRTTAQMQLQATYRLFNFITLWAIDEGNDYPVFQDLSIYDPPQPVDVTELEGTGTPENPYLITTIDELNAMRQDLTANYRLSNDIDLAATVIWDYGRGWEPIGAFGTGNQFTGSFDGGGYVIRNLTINRPTTTVQGLFGYVNSASLSNLTLQDVDIQAASISGGLAASLQASTVDNVTVTGAVISSLTQPYTAIGGLAGESSSSALHLIAITATIQGRTRVGGLAGRTGSGASEIGHSYSLGSVVGATDNVGGLVGYVGGAVTISDSYSQASVTGADCVGGLVGDNYTGAIHRAYSTGAVTGMGNNVGGLIGRSSGAVEASFWDVQTSGQPVSAEGTGKSTVQMQQRATFEGAGWDFDTVWRIHEGSSYPYLLALLSPDTTELIPPGGGSLFSIIDQTRYGFEPGTFSDAVRFTHTYQPSPPASAPEGMVDVGYTFSVTAVDDSTGQPRQPNTPVAITIQYGNAGGRGAASSPLSLWRRDGTGWVELESADEPVQQTLNAWIDHFSEFAVFGEAGHRVFLPLVLRQ